MNVSHAKVFRSILESTIWCESSDAKVLWITILLLSDKDGEVSGSVPGLARTAGIPLETCREVMARFMAPDPDSRSQIEDGRRLVAIPGGWRIVNHGEYREACKRAAKLERDAKAQAAQRDRDRSARVSESQRESAVVAHTDAAAASEAKNLESTHLAPDGAAPARRLRRPNPADEAWDRAFEEAWKSYPHWERRSVKPEALKCWRAVKPRPLADEIMEAIQNSAASSDWTHNGGERVPGMQVWIRNRRWECSNGNGNPTEKRYRTVEENIALGLLPPRRLT